MVSVYLHSCNCGINAIYVRKVRRWAAENNVDFEIKNSRYSESNRIDHAMYLVLAVMDVDFYDNIVVEDSGRITKLKEWQPSN